jgi:hypothetical protein
MPQYVFLLFDDESALVDASPQVWKEMLATHGRFVETVQAEGGRVLGGEALQPAATATVVRHTPGATAQLTDGPFIETKEALGGFYLVEAADLDQALEFARLCPCGAVEVRPVLDLSAWQ